jgi:hypothetical protein
LVVFVGTGEVVLMTVATGSFATGVTLGIAAETEGAVLVMGLAVVAAALGAEVRELPKGAREVEVVGPTKGAVVVGPVPRFWGSGVTLGVAVAERGAVVVRPAVLGVATGTAEVGGMLSRGGMIKEGDMLGEKVGPVVVGGTVTVAAVGELDSLTSVDGE